MSKNTTEIIVDPARVVQALGGPRAAAKRLDMSSSTLSRFQRYGFSRGFPWDEYFKLKIAAGDLPELAEKLAQK
jgi:hypothetical protein